MRHLLAFLVGSAWGGLAYVIGSPLSGRIILAGVLCSPVIGLVVYRLVQPKYEVASGGRRALVALGSLYLGSTAFAVAMGLSHWLIDLPSQPLEAFWESLGFVLYGTTMLIWALWPLAIGSHELLRRYRQPDGPDSITSAS